MFAPKLFNQLRSIFLAFLASSIPVAVTAQIAPDGSTSTEVTTEGDNTIIFQGDRNGNNLFHSFEEFSVPTGGSAVFNNAADIGNIFSRVTGGNISSIDGILGANGTANLYLINPNGIIFGENAQLNLGGSFFASTADSLLFEGDTEFSAVNPQAPPLLEVSIPIGARFRDNPGDIAINQAGLILVNPEGVLSLIGGKITINDGFLASESKIQLGGLQQAGNIEIKNNNLNFSDGVIRSDISIINSSLFVNSFGRDGNIAIEAKNLTLNDSGIINDSVNAVDFNNVGLREIDFNATNDITLNNSAIFNDGNIAIEAKNLTLNDSGIINDSVNAVDFNNVGLREIDFNATNDITLNNSAIFNDGNIAIEAKSLTLNDSGIINNSVNAIDFDNIHSTAIDLNAINDINFKNSFISNTVAENVTGDAGDIRIKANSLSLLEGSQINSETFGAGNAGDITIDAVEEVNVEGDNGSSVSFNIFLNEIVVDFSRIRSSTNADAEGNAGDIEIDTNLLSLSSGGQINNETFGLGDAGDITINATEEVEIGGTNSVNIEGAEFGSIATISSLSDINAEGNAGDIEIDTNSLLLSGGGLLSNNTFGLGDAGDITINASDRVDINGSSFSSFGETVFGNFATITSITNAEAEGDAGDITIDTNSLFLSIGAQINNSTFGSGNTGNIAIDVANKLTIDGFGSATLGEEFRASSSRIESLVLSNATGNSAGIDISAGSLSVTDSGQISSETRGIGDAGSLNIEIDDLLEVTSLDSGLFSRTGGTGNSGTVNISTSQLKVEDNAQIGVNNFIEIDLTTETFVNSLGIPITAIIRSIEPVEGSGNSGTLSITADTIELEDGGSLTAISAGGDGGNVVVNSDILSLDRGGNISAEAGLQDTSGGGGNIDIDSTLIIAFPGGNNNITANAFEGRGGNINIDTEGIFGIAQRTISILTNDINASSEFGLQGNIALNTPNADPISGLIDLPASVGDASEQISQNPCQQGVGSQFLVTGKGGLPPNPTENISNNEIEVGLVEPLSTEEVRVSVDLENVVSKIVPAMGWLFNEKGEVTLTAYSNTDRIAGRTSRHGVSCQGNFVN